jgi:DNA-binding CsgD family transcriptional regulator
MRFGEAGRTSPNPEIRDFVSGTRPRGRVTTSSSTHHQRVTDLWRAGMQAFELLGIGWLVCDSAGRLLGANRIASKILSTRDGLRLNSDGVPSTTRGRKELLAEAVQQAARPSGTKEEKKNNGAFFIVKRALGKRAFTLLVRSVEAVSTTQDCAPPVALVLILDPSLSTRAAESDLRRLHGFTAREACLATLLMDGSTLDDSCHKLGMGRSTACTHLKRMFKKTHVHRQSEMISVLLKTICLVQLRDTEANLNLQTSDRQFDQAVIRALGSRTLGPAMLPTH